MASSKDTFESGTFLARMFAVGTFRGTNATPNVHVSTVVESLRDGASTALTLGGSSAAEAASGAATVITGAH